MNKITNRLSFFQKSETLAIAKLARKLKQEGRDLVNLSAGEPDFKTPKNYCNAAQISINKSYTQYPSASGYLGLSEAIFGEDNCILISYASFHEYINKAMEKIKKAVNLLID